MAYKLILKQGDKVIVKVNGKWEDGVIEDIAKVKESSYNYAGIRLSNDIYYLVLFPGDKHYSNFGYKKLTVIKKVSGHNSKKVLQ